MPNTRMLLVDDDEAIRSTLSNLLRQQGFHVTAASNVPEALKLISSNAYDVLLSDLHMPGAGDGLTVVSAMRHANPNAVTMLLSAFPEMHAASHAILLQTDQILVKPMDTMALVAAIKERLTIGAPPARTVETVADILERTVETTIATWYGHIQRDSKVMSVPLSYEQRTGYLHQVLRDLAERLRSSIPIGAKEMTSKAAAEHGLKGKIIQA